MLKILVIDRCHFTRTGLEAWLNHSERFNRSFLVSGLNNLSLVKEHILQWKPHLVIADLYGFLNDTLSAQYIAPFFLACGASPLILLESGGMMSETQRYPVCASVSKQISLPDLAEHIHNALLSGSMSESPHNASPLLTPQEEKVLTMWMEGASNNAIACALSIHGKTVYTYKRNIRMKLHMDNRFSPFLTPIALKS
ncbi:helix-turn-helix transcriptional regulator [Citrobacter amalonaticus]|uniref:helix-turn-helix transcriptional regulator n=1 Tax=Citrobacter amalonaticus TaxID=35703 RepID=UPI00300BFB07